MLLSLYLIQLWPERLIATELDSDEAAVALDRGETLFVGRPVDLVRAALRQQRALTVCAQG